MYTTPARSSLLRLSILLASMSASSLMANQPATAARTPPADAQAARVEPASPTSSTTLTSSLAHQQNVLRFQSASRFRNMLMWLPLEAAIGAVSGGSIYAIAKKLNFTRPLVTAILVGAAAVTAYTSVLKYLAWRAEDDYLRKEMEIEHAHAEQPDAHPAPAPTRRQPSRQSSDEPGFDGLERANQSTP